MKNIPFVLQFFFFLYSGSLPSETIVTELPPVLDSANPNLKTQKPKEPDEPKKPKKPSEPFVEDLGEDMESDGYESNPDQGPKNEYVPPPPTNPSSNSIPHFDLTTSDPNLVNDLLNTIHNLRQQIKTKDKQLENAAKVKEEDEKIKKAQADKIEDLIKAKHVSDMELAQAKSRLKNIRSGVFTKAQKKLIIKEVMGKIGYTDKQLDCFIRGDWKRVQGWTEEDVKFALTLRTLSRKAYRFIRRRKLIPLAGESTLRGYMRNFQVPPGKMHSMIFLLFSYSKMWLD